MQLPRSVEMTTTRSDFARLLPAAVGHAPYVEEGNAFLHRDGARTWRIRLTPLADLRIGLIRLERQRVEFDFEGHSAAEIEAFLKRFELYMRRGGG